MIRASQARHSALPPPVLGPLAHGCTGAGTVARCEDDQVSTGLGRHTGILCTRQSRVRWQEEQRRGQDGAGRPFLRPSCARLAEVSSVACRPVVPQRTKRRRLCVPSEHNDSPLGTHRDGRCRTAERGWPVVRQARFAMLAREDKGENPRDRRRGSSVDAPSGLQVASAPAAQGSLPCHRGAVNFIKPSFCSAISSVVLCQSIAPAATDKPGCTIARSSLRQCNQPRAHTGHRTPLPQAARHRRKLAGLQPPSGHLAFAADPSHRQQFPCAASGRPRRTESRGIISSHAQRRFSFIPPPLDIAESHSPWLPRAPSPPRLANVGGAHLLRSTRRTCN